MKSVNQRIAHVCLQHLNYGMVIAKYPLGAIHNKIGSTHFVEHLLCKNNGKFFVHGATKKDNMILWTRVSKTELNDAINLFFNAGDKKPTLEEFQQEKVIIKDEIINKNLNKEYQFLEQLNEFTFEGDEYGNSVIGQISNLDDIEIGEIYKILESMVPNKLFLIGPWIEKDLNNIIQSYKFSNDIFIESNSFGIKPVYQALGFIGAGIKFPGELKHRKGVLEVIKRILLFRVKKMNPKVKTRISVNKQYLYLTIHQKKHYLSKGEIETILNSLHEKVSRQEYNIGIYLLKKDLSKFIENSYVNTNFDIININTLPSYKSVYNYFTSYGDSIDSETSIDISIKHDVLPMKQTTYLKNRNEYINMITSPLTSRCHILFRFETHNNILSKNTLSNTLKHYNVEEVRYEGTHTMLQVVIELESNLKDIILDVIRKVIKIKDNNQIFDESAHTEIKKFIVDNLEYLSNEDNKPVFKGLTICSSYSYNIKEIEYSLLNSEQLLNEEVTKIPSKIHVKNASNKTIVLSKLPYISEFALMIQEAAHGSHQLDVVSLQQRFRDNFGKYYFVQNILEIGSDFYIFWAVKGGVQTDTILSVVKAWLKDLQTNISHIESWYAKTNSFIDTRNHIAINSYLRDVDRRVYYVNDEDKDGELDEYIQKLIDNDEVIITS
ncbi:hypothetical protein ACE1TF_12340 [Geomicrobium sp. JSM 1781026]|uniref:hypothetical protein n=1 Tax=Geomicrobium sp. JSM 1781026 TaxID=3344580 RepID=UPI0035C1AC49